MELGVEPEGGGVWGWEGYGLWNIKVKNLAGRIMSS